MEIMKKFKYFLIGLLAVSSTLLVTSCDRIEEVPKVDETHVHDYRYDNFDSQNHWNECECGDKKKIEKHSFSEWKIVKDATATEAGLKERICDECYYREIEKINNGSHTHSYQMKYDSNNHWQECSCGDKKEEEKHSFGEWTITKNPTETEEGIKERKCGDCYYSEIAKFNNESHTHSYQTKYDFVNHWQECSCGDKKEVEKHSFGEWTITKNPTETEEGTKERECSICHYSEKENLPIVLPETESLEFAFNPGDNSYSVTGIGTVSTVDVTIPATYNNLPVTRISKEAFNQCKTLESIIIPDSVISIGTGAFFNCNSLNNISMSNGLTTIESNAFYRCYSLKSIVIPSGVTSIGQNAFRNCNRLVEIYNLSSLAITIGSKTNGYIGYNAKVIHSSLEEESNLIKKDDYVFFKDNMNTYDLVDYNGTTTEVVLPEDIDGNIYKIYNYAFYKCDGLTSITIPNSITSIGDYAFASCSNLTNISIPNNITSIGMYAFESCSSLKGMIIPNNLKEIPTGLFSECKKLEYIEIPEHVTKIGNNAFYGCFKLKNVIIPESVISIGDSAFSECYNFTSITIPESVTSIGKSAFYGCLNLSNVALPNNITSIGADAFSYCRNLKFNTYKNGNYLGTESNPYLYLISIHSKDISSFEMNNNTRIIAASTFANCKILNSIVIPESVTSIGNNAFSNCIRLVEVYNLSSLNITLGSRDYGYIGYYAKIIIYTLEEESSVITKDDYVFYKNPGNKYYLVGYNGTSNDLTLPNDIEGYSYEINESAFENYDNLTSITIPKSITSIGPSSIWFGSNLKNVYYEGTIEDWCNITFYSSDNNPMSHADHFYLRNSNYEWEEVTSIVIPDTITKIGYAQFSGFKNVTSISIPNSVTSIDDSAFAGCSSLSSIVIPNSVERISFSAFWDCKKLVEIYNLSALKITIGSEDNGYIGYYAKVIHTSLEEESNIIIKDEYVFVKNNKNKYFLIGYNGIETDLILPNNIDGHTYEINQYAFEYCSNLTSIIIPENITAIGDNAFYYCKNLTSVTIGNSVTSIGNYAFDNCSSLKNVKIGNNVISIGNYAFWDCYSLISVTIGNNVKSIADNAFGGCDVLFEVYNLSSLNIIIGSKDNGSIGYNAKVIHTSLEEKSNLITKDDFVFFRDNKNKYYLVGYDRTLKELVFPDNIEGNTYEISFDSIDNIERIVIPVYMNKPFQNSIIKEVKITGGTSIRNIAFRNCSNLTTIVLSNTITYIEDSAFKECTSLQEVFYTGTAAEWNSIDIETGNIWLHDATIYYYSETRPTTSGNYWHYVNGVATKW